MNCTSACAEKRGCVCVKRGCKGESERESRNRGARKNQGAGRGGNTRQTHRAYEHPRLVTLRGGVAKKNGGCGASGEVSGTAANRRAHAAVARARATHGDDGAGQNGGNRGNEKGGREAGAASSRKRRRLSVAYVRPASVAGRGAERRWQQIAQKQTRQCARAHYKDVRACRLRTPRHPCGRASVTSRDMGSE